jgi:xanthine dehydrogenase large subunit
MSEQRTHVGKPIPHESAAVHVTGAALYTDDLGARFVDLLHGWPACAPHAHAYLTKLDVSAALATPGVVTVLTAADVTGENDTGPSRRDEPLFPRPPAGESTAWGEILYHSMPIAWVMADSLEAAKLGASRVIAEYEPLPAILTISDAVRAGSFHTEIERIRRGEPERAIQSAAHRVTGTVDIGGQEHFYLETHATIAVVDESGSLLVHCSTQHPTETQDIVARVCGLAKSQVIVQQLRMGGGFGGKETQANPYASVAALAAIKTGRPTRVRLDRMRDFQLSGKRHPFRASFEVGFDAQGKIEGVLMDLVSDGGYSLDLSFPVLGRAMFHSDNAYFLPNVQVSGRAAKTHKCSNTAFRGFGGPQGMVAIEEVLDAVARSLGLSPHVVRERNLYGPTHTTHYEQAVDDAERIHRIWSELKSESDFDRRLAAIEDVNAHSPMLKRGIAITPVKFGISFTAKYYNQAGALVLVYKDGSVQVSHGGTEMGQGLYTKTLQIAADALGVELEAVRVMPTRTDKVPNTSATAASAGADLNGAAVKNACETLRERLAEVAGRAFSAPPGDIVFRRGVVHVVGKPDKTIAFGELCDRAYHERVQLWASGFYKTPLIHWDQKAGRGRPFYYFAWGAAVTEVEVDGYTGMYAIRRVDLVHDVGDSLSPLIDLGQVEGGFAQGAGWLTQEELVWDAAGALKTSNASTYKLPSLGECPPVFRARLLERAAQPGVVYGSKAVGEPPLMLAISVREAIRAAVAAFASRSRRAPIALACPSTAEHVYWAIEAVRASHAETTDEHAAPRV